MLRAIPGEPRTKAPSPVGALRHDHESSTAHGALLWEDVINTKPHIPNLTTLREKIDKDRLLLQSLDPESDAYRRLQQQLTHATEQLLDYEQAREQRRREAAAEAVRLRQAEEERAPLLGGLLFAVIGGVITYAAWGSWWVLLGIVLLLVALIGVLGYAFDQR